MRRKSAITGNFAIIILFEGRDKTSLSLFFQFLASSSHTFLQFLFHYFLCFFSFLLHYLFLLFFLFSPILDLSCSLLSSYSPIFFLSSFHRIARFVDNELVNTRSLLVGVLKRRGGDPRLPATGWLVIISFRAPPTARPESLDTRSVTRCLIEFQWNTGCTRVEIIWITNWAVSYGYAVSHLPGRR